MSESQGRNTEQTSSVDDDDLAAQRAALRELLELPLRTAVRRLAHEGTFDQSTLREELRAICEDARQRGLRAEQLLIAVKEIWANEPIARDIANNAGGTPFLTQVVTMALDAYYR
jgi:lambda repressor-like predicted transcriptional regulator